MIYKRTVLMGILIATLAVVVGAGTVAGQSAPDCSQVSYNGDGTEQNPYEVGNVDQLQCIKEDLDANYVQVSDINATGTPQWNGNDGFNPIGPALDARFTGTFDGNGNTIRGLTIRLGNKEYRNRNKGTHVGLFGAVGSDTGVGTVKEVTLENADVSGHDSVGTLVGRNTGTVKRSSATGDVSGGTSTGGLVGSNRNTGTVNLSSADVEVSILYDSGDSMGGLVGLNFDGTVRSSYARGGTTGTGAVGGLVGRGSTGTIENSYATGEVSDADTPGGLVGGPSQGDVDGSYWDREATGQLSSQGGTPLTTSEMTGSDATGNMSGFGFTSAWDTATNPDRYPVLAWQTDEYSDTVAFDASVESTNSPVKEGENLTVTTMIMNTGENQETQTVTWNIGGLVNPTSSSVTLNRGETTSVTREVPTEEGDAGDYLLTVSSDKGTFSETVTVESETGSQFAPNCGEIVDTYEGDGTESDPYEVTNVSQLDCVSARGTGFYYELVSDIDASGTEDWNGGKGLYPIQGLSAKFEGAGHNITGLSIDRPDPLGTKVALFNEISATGEIANLSLKDVEIIGDVTETAALVGFNNGGTVRRSSVSGNVLGGDRTGGIVSENVKGTIKNSYFIGRVAAAPSSPGTGKAGGIASINQNITFDDINQKATITDSYAVVDTLGSVDSGGIVAENSGGIVDDSYYNVSAGNSPGTALNLGEMKGEAAQSNMTGLDFTNTWSTVTNPDDYPVLAWQTESDDGGGVEAISGLNDPGTLEQKDVSAAISELLFGDGTVNGTEITQEDVSNAISQLLFG